MKQICKIRPIARSLKKRLEPSFHEEIATVYKARKYKEIHAPIQALVAFLCLRGA
jgi:hypothetical protein